MTNLNDSKVYCSGIDRFRQNVASLQAKGFSILLDRFTVRLLCRILIPVIDPQKKIGFISTNSGDLVIEPIYDEIKGCFDSEESVVAVKKSGKWGAIDKYGKEVLPIKYVAMTPPINGIGPFAAQISEDGHYKWGIIDRFQNPILPYDSKYSEIEGFDGGLCRVSIKGKGRGVINVDGRYVIPIIDGQDIWSIYDKGYDYIVKEYKDKEDNNRKKEKILKIDLLNDIN